MRFPLGRKGLVAISAAAGALAFWKVRSRKREQENREWEAEVAGAVEEGRAAADKGSAGESGAV